MRYAHGLALPLNSMMFLHLQAAFTCIFILTGRIMYISTYTELWLYFKENTKVNRFSPIYMPVMFFPYLYQILRLSLFFSFFFLSFFFLVEFCSVTHAGVQCHNRLTATSASHVQVILLPQPPE